MMFPQFGSEATIEAFTEFEHEHSREIIEIFSRDRRRRDHRQTRRFCFTRACERLANRRAAVVTLPASASGRSG
jgi:hypothetical protein